MRPRRVRDRTTEARRADCEPVARWNGHSASGTSRKKAPAAPLPLVGTQIDPRAYGHPVPPFIPDERSTLFQSHTWTAAVGGCRAGTTGKCQRENERMSRQHPGRVKSDGGTGAMQMPRFPMRMGRPE